MLGMADNASPPTSGGVLHGSIDCLPESVLARLIPQLLADGENLSLRVGSPHGKLHVLLEQMVLAAHARTPDVGFALTQHLHLDVLCEARPTDAVAIAPACGVAPAVV